MAISRKWFFWKHLDFDGGGGVLWGVLRCKIGHPTTRILDSSVRAHARASRKSGCTIIVFTPEICVSIADRIKDVISWTRGCLLHCSWSRANRKLLTRWNCLHGATHIVWRSAVSGVGCLLTAPSALCSLHSAPNLYFSNLLHLIHCPEAENCRIKKLNLSLLTPATKIGHRYSLLCVFRAQVLLIMRLSKHLKYAGLFGNPTLDLPQGPAVLLGADQLRVGSSVKQDLRTNPPTPHDFQLRVLRSPFCKQIRDPRQVLEEIRNGKEF